MRHQTRMTRYCQMLASPAVTFMLSRTTLRRLGRLLMKRQRLVHLHFRGQALLPTMAPERPTPLTSPGGTRANDSSTLRKESLPNAFMVIGAKWDFKRRVWRKVFPDQHEPWRSSDTVHALTRQERTCSLNQCSRAVDLKPHHIIILENYIHE